MYLPDRIACLSRLSRNSSHVPYILRLDSFKWRIRSRHRLLRLVSALVRSLTFEQRSGLSDLVGPVSSTWRYPPWSSSFNFLPTRPTFHRLCTRPYDPTRFLQLPVVQQQPEGSRSKCAVREVRR